MMGRYQDLDQFTLFPMDEAKVRREGIYRVLSGEAAERAALKIIQKQIDPNAKRHRQAHGALVPDLTFSFMGYPVWGEVKSVNMPHGDVLLRMDQHHNFGLVERDHQDANVAYCFLLHPPDVQTIAPADLVGWFLAHGRLRLLSLNEVDWRLHRTGARAYIQKSMVEAHERYRRKHNIPKGRRRGWAAYLWWRVKGSRFFEGWEGTEYTFAEVELQGRATQEAQTQG
jgi:uncharacterized protein YijF (DUF1287 family)